MASPTPGAQSRAPRLTAEAQLGVGMQGQCRAEGWGLSHGDLPSKPRSRGPSWMHMGLVTSQLLDGLR